MKDKDMNAFIGTFDNLLEVMGGQKDSPTELRIMYYNRQSTKLFQKILISQEFMTLPEDDEIKKSLLTLKEKEFEILKQIEEKLDIKGE